MQELGVVNHVVPRAQVLPTARALAGRLARKSPLAMKLLRDAFVRANDLDYRRAIEGVVETMCSLKDSPTPAKRCAHSWRSARPCTASAEPIPARPTSRRLP